TALSRGLGDVYKRQAAACLSKGSRPIRAAGAASVEEGRAISGTRSAVRRRVAGESRRSVLRASKSCG
ncbi:MAG: hypothetical protein QUU85_05575, partial [Candidatus Eisenbacteria bacterium]|nr:hypothetical protein [Candidatus Eisenbacteria bacterium]